jgi:hypothetical protein
MELSATNALSNQELQFAKLWNMPTMHLCFPLPYTYQDPITPEICNLRVLHYELVDKFHKFKSTTCTIIFHLEDHGGH